MSSNATLSSIVSESAEKKYEGADRSKRPDLLLSTGPGDRYLLIEFKRPTHAISRQDEAQAQEYADKLSVELPGNPFDVLIIGGKRATASRAQNDSPNLKVESYRDIISRARYEVEWLLKTTLP
jgi:hypothetical protein